MYLSINLLIRFRLAAGQDAGLFMFTLLLTLLWCSINYYYIYVELLTH